MDYSQWKALMGDLGQLEGRVKDIEEIIEEHDEKDNQRFDELRKVCNEISGKFDSLARTINEALFGMGDTAGIKERLRILERDKINRDWWIRILMTAVVGEGVVIAFRIFGGKM